MQHRISPWAIWIPYGDGTYHVTICTRDGRKFFGSIHGGVFTPTPLGKIAQQTIDRLAEHYPFGVEVLCYAVMPNHIHILLEIRGSELISGKKTGAMRPGRDERDGFILQREHHNSPLAIVIGGLKSSISRRGRTIVPDFGWQPRYHDNRVKTIRELSAVAEYISLNVAKWHTDEYYTK